MLVLKVGGNNTVVDLDWTDFVGEAEVETDVEAVIRAMRERVYVVCEERDV
jgi:hypothetical protein